MVHALQEAWRVLKPLGSMIDLRPIYVDAPLSILTESGWKFAGLVDRSQFKADNAAANGAMQVVVHEGLFKRLKRKYFDANYYWNDLKELKMDAEGSWAEDFIISREIWRRARLLFKDGKGQGRIRIPFHMKITRYQKLR